MDTVTVTVTTDNPHAYARLVELLEANPPDLDRHGTPYDATVIVTRAAASGAILASWVSEYDGAANRESALPAALAPRCIWCHSTLSPDPLTRWTADANGSGDCPDNPNSVNHESRAGEEDDDDPTEGAMRCPWGCGYWTHDATDMRDHGDECRRRPRADPKKD